MLLLTCLVNGFKIKPKKLFNLLVEQFDLATIIIKFMSLVFETVVSSLYCSMIALYSIYANRAVILWC